MRLLPRTVPSRLEPLAAWVTARDSHMIIATMVGIYLLFIVFGLLLIPLNSLLGGLASTLQRVTFLTAVYAMLVLALNLHWGYTGLFNIGVAGFVAVGVYVMAVLFNPPSASPPGLGVPQGVAAALPVAPGVGFFLGLVLCVVLGMLAAGVVGALVSLPALRLRADYLAIVTIAFSEIIRLSLLSRTLESFTVFGVPIGSGAGRGINLPTNPVRAIYYVDPNDTTAGLTAVGEVAFDVFGALGISSGVVIAWTYTWVLVLVVAAFYWLLVRIGNSPFGRVLKAIREDEVVATSLGKDTRVVKVKVFMVGCALMGLAGILWEGSKGFTDPTSTTFLPLQTFYVFIALIIGGAGSNTGSVLGGAIFASLLYEGPVFVARVITEYLDLGTPPATFAEAAGALATADPLPFLAYSLDNISTLRFVLLGVLLVILMQRRPEGLLGHRKEEAASVDLSVRPARQPSVEVGGDE